MDELVGKYINPFTDYGFKYLFGTEPNKEFTLALVNELLHGQERIKSLTLIPSERLRVGEHSSGIQLGDTKEDRRAVFDVYAENERGEKIIIEMQKADQQYFKDRSVFYSSFPIRSQGERGKWRFGLKAVYTFGILDFVFDEDKDDENYFHHEVKLMDVNKKEVFYDKLTYIYLEMPKFKKTEAELVTLFDKWLYALKNLPRLMERPAALQERIFKKFFDVAQTANLSKEEYAKYFESEKVYYDLDGAFRTASNKGYDRGMAKGMEQGLAKGMAKGMEQGLAKGKAEVASQLKSMGLPISQIAQATGLTTEEIETL
ncbi:MAG: Rpn family recombination-promoting nuclease/putative transposase [Prevotella sp.]|nr:Rpn family recombination-promoting nuclease/putative transposase [Prevotella sp.]